MTTISPVAVILTRVENNSSDTNNASAAVSSNPQLRQFFYEVCIPIILILCILAIVFNIAVLISRSYVKTRTASLELTYSLSVSDTWTSIVIAVSLFWNSYKPVVLELTHTNFCISLTLEAFRTGGMLTAILHLVALSFAHYVQIVRPFDHARCFTIRMCHVLIFLIWALPPVGLVIYFASWEGQGYRSDSCRENAMYDNFTFRLYISLIIIILMLITCVIYWRLLSAVSQVRTKTLMGTGNSRGRKTVVTAVFIFGTFILGWMPASAFFILTAESMPLYRNPSTMIIFLSTSVLICIMIKSMVNPIVYATRIPEVHRFVHHRILRRPIRPSDSTDGISNGRRRSDMKQHRVTQQSITNTDKFAL